MPKNVKQTLYGAELDLTTFKTLNREKLMAKIDDECQTSIMFAGRHHPDKLLITMSQFIALEDDTQQMDATEDRIYHTAKGFVLEVRIVMDKPDWEALLARGEGLELYGQDGEEWGEVDWENEEDNAPDKTAEELLGGKDGSR